MTMPHPPDNSDADARAMPPDWPALLAAHQRWLRTVVLARLRSADGVDEVLQEVSLAVVRGRAPLVDPSKVAPWLYRLAVVQSLLYRRRCGRQRKLVDRFAQRNTVAEHDDAASDPLLWLLADERRQLVRNALKQLPSRDAEVLLLKYTEHWSYHQLAAHLGISHSAVETRLHRARARLRAELTKLEVIEVSS
jgi:RNA polymerase sigma factor (sigma-70 family)